MQPPCNGLSRFDCRRNNTIGKPSKNFSEAQAAQAEFARQFLSEDVVSLLNSSRFARQRNCLLFHPQQQRYLLLYVLANCRPDDAPFDPQAVIKDFGIACLVVNDLLDTPANTIDANTTHEREGLRRLDAAGKLAPVIEQLADDELFGTDARAAQLWVHIPRGTLKDDAVCGQFDRRYSVSIAQLLRILVFIHAKSAMDPGVARTAWEPYIINGLPYFSNLKCSSEALQSALEILSYPLDKWDRLLADHTPRSRQTDSQYAAEVPSDTNQPGIVHILRHCIARQVRHLWHLDAVAESCRRRRGKAALQISAFKEKHLRRTAIGYWPIRSRRWRGRFRPTSTITRPGSLTGARRAISLLKQATSLIMIEAKGIYLTANARYGGLSALRQDVDAKLVGRDESGKRKAVLQLAHNCDLILDGEPLRNVTLDLTAIRNVYPVVIVPEVAMAGSLFSRYLNEEFPGTRIHGNTVVRPQ